MEENMETRKIGVFVGSLRKESFSMKMAKTLIQLAPASFAMEIVELSELTIYNQDLDDQEYPPAFWTAFRDRVKTFDAVLFVTPEYNRSVPAVLKNALDIGSRPFGKSAWNGKPGAVVSISPGAMGAFGANHHLRQSLVFLNVPVMPQPEAYIGNAAALFDDKGVLVNGKTAEFLQQFMDSFAQWVEAISHRI